MVHPTGFEPVTSEVSGIFTTAAHRQNVPVRREEGPGNIRCGGKLRMKASSSLSGATEPASRAPHQARSTVRSDGSPGAKEPQTSPPALRGNCRITVWPKPSFGDEVTAILYHQNFGRQNRMKEWHPINGCRYTSSRGTSDAGCGIRIRGAHACVETLLTKK